MPFTIAMKLQKNLCHEREGFHGLQKKKKIAHAFIIKAYPHTNIWIIFKSRATNFSILKFESTFKTRATNFSIVIFESHSNQEQQISVYGSSEYSKINMDYHRYGNMKKNIFVS